MSLTNSILTDEELSLVNDCAGRLSVIQGDAAAIPAERRREYLSEEINHSFKTLPAARRKPCLESLLARFPVAGKIGQSQTPPPATTIAAVPDSPARLVERLVAVAGQLSEAQRTEFAVQLAEAGLAASKNGAPSMEITRELQTRFGLAPGQPLPLERVVQLASLLVQVLGDLDRTAVNVLRELYPRSAVLNRSEDFRKATAQYLAGGHDNFEPHLRVTAALLAGMLAALLGGGRDFSRQFLDKFKPDSIEEVVVSEGRFGSIMKPSKKECCWDKYCSLSRDIATSDQLERWLKDCLGKFADSGIKNIR